MAAKILRVVVEEGRHKYKVFSCFREVKKAKKTIFRIKEIYSSNLIINILDIQAKGVNFFKKLLDPPSGIPSINPKEHKLLDSITPLITTQDNENILAPFTLQEVYKVVFLLP